MVGPSEIPLRRVAGAAFHPDGIREKDGFDRAPHGGIFDRRAKDEWKIQPSEINVR